MKTLYFDIDGTVLVNNRDAVKESLGEGQFEKAVRSAGFSQLVCVGNFAAIANTVREFESDYDALGVLFKLCRGAFRDESWLRASTSLVEDPQNRAHHIDYSGDWWYLDDLAEHYMTLAGRRRQFEENLGVRVFSPEPLGEGHDVLDWLGGPAL